MVVIQNLAKVRSGATSIEYGLIAATIAAVIIGVTTLVGFQLFGIFDSVVTAVLGTSE